MLQRYQDSTAIKALLCISAISLFAARFMLLQCLNFSGWDDEGYILITLRDYVLGVPIFQGFYTQYGPAAFQLKELLHSTLSVSITNDGARVMSALLFSLSLICLTLALFRVAESTSVLLLCVFAIGHHMMAAVTEPGHPQDLAMLIFSLIALTCTLAPSRNRDIGLGCLLACLFLIKINLGAFVFLALVASSRGPACLLLIKRILLVLFPFALMHSRFDQGWVVNFAVAASLQIILLFARPSLNATIGISWRSLLVGFVAVAVGICGIEIFFHGVNPSALVDGMVLRHLDYPKQVAREAFFPADSIFLTVLVFVFEYFRRHKAAGNENRIRTEVVDATRCLAAMWVLGGTLAFGAEVLMAYGIPLTALLAGSEKVIGDEKERAQLTFSNLFAFLSCLFVLQAFPVGGTQVALGTIPLVMLACCTLNETFPRVMNGNRSWLLAPIAAVGLLYQAKDLIRLDEQYRTRPSLDLNGAYLLHLSEDERETFHALVNEIAQHETFISDPGLNSLYLWTRSTPPTHKNAGAWRVLLTNEEQRAIVEAIRSRDTIAIRDPKWMYFWSGFKKVGSPLSSYIDNECSLTKKIARYEIWQCQEKRTDNGI